MKIKYIIYEGNDYGLLPTSLKVNLNLKSDEGKGYSELEINFPLDWDLIKWKTGDICSIITENDGHFFLFLDFKIKNVFYEKVVLTSKQYVDFQPIIKLGSQL